MVTKEEFAAILADFVEGQEFIEIAERVNGFETTAVHN